MLVPISQKHSINRVIANLILPQIVIKPKYIFDKIIENPELAKYQRKGLLTSKIINLDNNNISSDEINGFVLEEFNSFGKTVSVLKIENGGNKANISFENRDYSRWDNFKERFYEDLDSIEKSFEIYVEAVSLTYIDEFNWNSPDLIDVNKIFDIKSEFLNSSFINSYNGTLILISQTKKSENIQFEEEKTEILFNNDVKRIIVNHTFAVKANEIKIYSSDKDLLKGFFESAHNANKELLKKILNPNIQEIIGLI